MLFAGADAGLVLGRRIVATSREVAALLVRDSGKSLSEVLALALVLFAALVASWMPPRAFDLHSVAQACIR